LAPSIAWGGLLCVAGVALCIPALPAFWRYRQAAADEGLGADREPAENA
jgi:hypothetical protein